MLPLHLRLSIASRFLLPLRDQLLLLALLSSHLLLLARPLDANSLILLHLTHLRLLLQALQRLLALQLRGVVGAVAAENARAVVSLRHELTLLGLGLGLGLRLALRVPLFVLLN